MLPELSNSNNNNKTLCLGKQLWAGKLRLILISYAYSSRDRHIFTPQIRIQYSSCRLQ